MQTGPQKGFTLTGVSVVPSVVPSNGSIKFTITVHLANDATGYGYGYVVPGRRTYIFMTYSSDKLEPPLFASFVQSFTLLSPNVNSIVALKPSRFIPTGTAEAVP